IRRYRRGIWDLELGISLELGVWDLVFRLHTSRPEPIASLLASCPSRDPCRSDGRVALLIKRTSNIDSLREQVVGPQLRQTLLRPARADSRFGRHLWRDAVFGFTADG